MNKVRIFVLIALSVTYCAGQTPPAVTIDTDSSVSPEVQKKKDAHSKGKKAAKNGDLKALVDSLQDAIDNGPGAPAKELQLGMLLAQDAFNLADEDNIDDSVPVDDAALAQKSSSTVRVRTSDDIVRAVANAAINHLTTLPRGKVTSSEQAQAYATAAQLAERILGDVGLAKSYYQMASNQDANHKKAKDGNKHISILEQEERSKADANDILRQRAQSIQFPPPNG